MTTRGDVVAMHKFVHPVRTFALSAGSFFITTIATLIVISALAAWAGPSASSAAGTKRAGKKTMRAFTSEDELKAYFRQLAEAQRRQARRARSEERRVGKECRSRW